MHSKQLATILAEKDAVKYKAIIERAALNGYHDYKFDHIPGHPEYGECICPKMQLVEDLFKFPELADIRQDVIQGKYDDKPDKEDNDFLRKELLDNGASQAFIKTLGL